MQVQDALGRSLTLADPPRRIVSLVPSLTELLADLGLDDEVVGLTTFCVRPRGWREAKTRVGGTKQVKVERLLALAPDLVIANKEENTAADVEALAAHVPVYVTDIGGVDAALEAIRALGRVVGRAPQAEHLAQRIAAAFVGVGVGPPLRVAYLIWREPWMAVGSATFIHDVLGRGGFVNAFADRPRYPEVTADDLRAAEPDAILLSSEPYPFKEAHAEALRAAVPGARVTFVDGELYSWYGSRLLHTPAALQALRGELT